MIYAQQPLAGAKKKEEEIVEEKPVDVEEEKVLGGKFAYNPYRESQEVIDARNAMINHNANAVSAWTGGQYGQALQQAINKIQNREKFSYDMNADALYQQYKDRYINLGKMAMQDTIGQASGMTGGYGNSYAATAGNQSYQNYLQGLNDKVPELYQLAMDTYNNEGQRLLDNYNILNSQYNNEYGQYRDKVSDWYTEANRLSDNYYNAYNKDYGLYSDNYDRALQMAKYNDSLKSSNVIATEESDGRPDGMDDATWKAAQSIITRLNKGDVSVVTAKKFLLQTMSERDADAFLYQNGYLSDNFVDPNQFKTAVHSKGNYRYALEDIKSMDKESAKDFIKEQLEAGNLSTQEYNTLYNKIRG